MLSSCWKSRAPSSPISARSRSYLTDPRYREAVYRVVGKWLKGVYPVSTGLVIQALARPEWVVEVDVFAVIPEKHLKSPPGTGGPSAVEGHGRRSRQEVAPSVVQEVQRQTEEEPMTFSNRRPLRPHRHARRRDHHIVDCGLGALPLGADRRWRGLDAERHRSPGSGRKVSICWSKACRRRMPWRS